MSNRKLNIRRVRDAAIWLTLMAGIATLLFFSVRHKADAEVKTLEVHFEGVNENSQLITEKEVIRILSLAAGKTISKSNIKSLDLQKLEAKLNKDKRIGRAELYFDSKNRLNVRISQKRPMLRVIEVSGEEYFLDEKGHKIPFMNGSAVRVPILTGIRDTFQVDFLTSEQPSKLKEVYNIMSYVIKDAFLSSLIEQVHVEDTDARDVVLIPKIGREKIIFGNDKDIEDKFYRLKIFYRDGLPKLGWSRYKTLNLKYANQVAGTLLHPELAEKIKPVMRDSLQAEVLNTDNNKQSIHH